MTFLYCCTFEHAYEAVAWQWFGQIRYITLDDSKEGCSARTCINITHVGKKEKTEFDYCVRSKTQKSVRKGEVREKSEHY
jgi:hypothetical protein